ncbi:MAG: DUF554 domain-containing protein [Thermofilaceae archaeon]
MLGTLANATAVVTGSAAGLLLGRKLPERLFDLVRDVVGLFTLVLGVGMAVTAKNPLVQLFSLIIGAIVGESLKIEERLEKLASLFSSGSSRFVDGLMTAFLTYCVGPMTIVGSIKDGLGDPTILLTKSEMDGIVSVAYAASLGVGVLASAAPLLLFQGSLVLIGWVTKAIFPETVVSEITACGGVLLIGVGVNLLKLRKVKVGNTLPSLLFAALLAWALA